MDELVTVVVAFWLVAGLLTVIGAGVAVLLWFAALGKALDKRE